MINLLPPAIKQAYRYGRLNRHLAHWISVFAIGIVGAGIITGFGYMYLTKTAETYSRQVEETNKQLAAQNLSGVQREVKDISNNFKLVVDVLSKQVLFSELLTQFATLLPPDTNLTGLSISQTQGALDITAATKSFDAATQIQVNLTADNNQLFSKADIVSINCSGTSAYPCTVIIRALFAPTNPYMFTNNAKGVSNGQ